MTWFLLLLIVLLAVWVHWLHRLVDYRGDCIHALQDERADVERRLQALESDLMLAPRQDIRRRA